MCARRTPPPANTREVTAAETPDDLLRRYRATRDPDALGALFDAVAPALFRVARSLVGDAALAEDVLQETFLAAIEGVSRFDPARPAVPWMTGILARQAARARRRAARRPDPARVAAPPPQAEPGKIAEELEDAERLGAALDGLPEPYRGVALMRWRYGLEPAEIADIRGQAPGTVWSLLSRAKERLKRALLTAPAVLLALRAERGLAGVRDAVVRSARTRGVMTTAGTGSVLAAAGGGLVAKKTVAGAVAALLLLLTAGVVKTVWFASPSPRPPAEVERVADLGRRDLARTRKSAPEDAAASSAGPTAPGGAAAEPVDLDAADRERDLFGVVVDEQGAGVAGAVLTTARLPWREWRTMTPGVQILEAAGPAAVSARDGSFRLRLSRGALIDLRIACEGYVPVALANCQAGERMRVVLERGVALSVTVTESDGSPAAGALVHVWNESYWGQPSVDTAATTAADGTARCTVLAARSCYVEASRPAGAAAPIDMVEIPASGEVTRGYVLPAGRTLHGTVTDAETGAPIAHARVGEGWIQRRFVETDADGRYELEHWVGVSYPAVSVYADGYVWQRVRQPEGDVVDFRLAPGDWAVGRVMDANGAPVAGARIVASARAGDPREPRFEAPATVSGADGTFALTGLDRALTHTLTVRADGHGATSLDFAPARPAGEIRLGDVVLGAARVIAGIAYDGKGALRAGVMVAISGGNDDHARTLGDDAPDGAVRSSGMRRTDDLGRFCFPDLAPGTYVLDAAGAQRTVQLAETDVTDVILGSPDVAAEPVPAGPRSSLRFVVRDGAGDPVAGASVSVRGADARRSSQTAADGTVALDGLVVEDLSYTVSGPRGTRGYVRSKGGPVTPAGQELVITLSRMALIRGRVVGPDGAPLPRQEIRAVNVKGDADPHKDVVIGARGLDDGTFEIEAVLGEAYDLSLGGNRQETRADGVMLFVPTPFRGSVAGVEAPSHDVLLRGWPPADRRDLTVRVVDPDGRPLEGLQIQVEGKVQDVSGADGAVHFAALPQEEVRVIVMPARGAQLRDDLLPPPVTAVTPDGGTLTLTCPRGAGLRGRVLLPDGVALEGAVVFGVLSDRSRSLVPVVCDHDGRFRITLVPGRAHLVGAEWTSAAGTVFRAIVEGVTAETADLELRLVEVTEEGK